MIQVCDILAQGSTGGLFSPIAPNFISPEDTLLKELSRIPTDLCPQVMQGAAANIEDLDTLNLIEKNLNTPTMQECTSLLVSSSKLWEMSKPTSGTVAEKILSAHYNQSEKAAHLTQALVEFKVALVERRAQLLSDIATSHSLPLSANSIPLTPNANGFSYTALKNSTNTDALDILRYLGIEDPTVALAANIKSECATEKLDSLFRTDSVSGGKLVKKALSEPMKQITPTLAAIAKGTANSVEDIKNTPIDSRAILDAIKDDTLVYYELCVVMKDTIESLVDGFSAVAKDKANEYATKDMKPADVFAKQMQSAVTGLIGLGMSVPASLGMQAEGISAPDRQAAIKLGTFLKSMSNEDLVTLLKDNLPDIASYLDGSIINDRYLADAFPTLNKTELTQLGYFEMKSADQVAMAKLAPSDLQALKGVIARVPAPVLAELKFEELSLVNKLSFAKVVATLAPSDLQSYLQIGLQALKDVQQSVSAPVLAELKFEKLGLVNKLSFAKGVATGRETLNNLLSLSPDEASPLFKYSQEIQNFMNAIMPLDVEGGSAFETHVSKIFNAIYQSSDNQSLAKDVFETLGSGPIGDLLGVLGDKDATLRMSARSSEKQDPNIALSANLNLIRNVMVYEAICQLPVAGQENMSSNELEGAYNDAISSYLGNQGHPAVQASRIFELGLNEIMANISNKSEHFEHNNIHESFINDNITRSLGNVTIANERIESIPVIQKREAQLPEAQRTTKQQVIEATAIRLGELIPDVSLRKAVTSIASQLSVASLIPAFKMTAAGTGISTGDTTFSFDFNTNNNTFIMKFNVKMDTDENDRPLNGSASLEYRGQLTQNENGIWSTKNTLNTVTDLKEQKRLYNCKFE